VISRPRCLLLDRTGGTHAIQGTLFESRRRAAGAARRRPRPPRSLVPGRSRRRLRAAGAAIPGYGAAPPDDRRASAEPRASNARLEGRTTRPHKASRSVIQARDRGVVPRRRDVTTLDEAGRSYRVFGRCTSRRVAAATRSRRNAKRRARARRHQTRRGVRRRSRAPTHEDVVAAAADDTRDSSSCSARTGNTVLAACYAVAGVQRRRPTTQGPYADEERQFEKWKFLRRIGGGLALVS